MDEPTKSPTEQPSERTTTRKPTQNDVLCGRGASVNSHPGNEHFRKLVEKHRGIYFKAHFKQEKRFIASTIVSEIRDLEPPGRFLAKTAGSDIWIDVGDNKARDKTSQALRENARSNARAKKRPLTERVVTSPSYANRPAKRSRAWLLPSSAAAPLLVLSPQGQPVPYLPHHLEYAHAVRKLIIPPAVTSRPTPSISNPPVESSHFSSTCKIEKAGVSHRETNTSAGHAPVGVAVPSSAPSSLTGGVPPKLDSEGYPKSSQQHDGSSISPLTLPAVRLDRSSELPDESQGFSPVRDPQNQLVLLLPGEPDSRHEANAKTGNQKDGDLKAHDHGTVVQDANFSDLSLYSPTTITPSSSTDEEHEEHKKSEVSQLRASSPVPLHPAGTKRCYYGSCECPFSPIKTTSERQAGEEADELESLESLLNSWESEHGCISFDGDDILFPPVPFQRSVVGFDNPDSLAV